MVCVCVCVLKHSCAPNMVKKAVIVGKQDLRLHRVCFFAARSLPAGTELTWDYQMKAPLQGGRRIPCKCGAPQDKCRGWLY